MEQTANLNLPFILPAQAQKHVTHNEALQALDALVQLSVLSRSLTDPPDGPGEGERYLVPDGATGEWAGHSGRITAFLAGAWTLFAPRAGWIAYVEDEALLLGFDGAAWAKAGGDRVNPADLVGVNTIADATNRLAVKSDAVLLSHDDVTPGSGSIQLKLNKALPGGTSSLLCQTGWSGRAEFGLAGDDDFHLKVSPDGADWTEALRVDRVSGETAFQGLRHARAGNAPANTILFTPGGDGVISIYRIDTDSPQNPRSATIAGISGDSITLTTPVADTIFGLLMGGVSLARIWNISRSPDGHSAWVKDKPDASTLQVHSAADLAGWLPGDTIQLGDPVSITPNRCITLDISPMLVNLFGQAFRQTGVIVKSGISSADPADITALSATGAGGSFINAAAGTPSSGVTLAPCTELSPISNSNLLRLRETISATAGIRLVSVLAVLV